MYVLLFVGTDIYGANNMSNIKNKATSTVNFTELKGMIINYE